MSETELAQKLGVSRKCLWERRQRFGIPRSKSSGTGGISSRVGMLRPQWDDPDQDRDQAFLRAFDMVETELMGYIPMLHRRLKGREAFKVNILERFKHHPSGALIWFENGKEFDWQDLYSEVG